MYTNTSYTVYVYIISIKCVYMYLFKKVQLGYTIQQYFDCNNGDVVNIAF